MSLFSKIATGLGAAFGGVAGVGLPQLGLAVAGGGADVFSAVQQRNAVQDTNAANAQQAREQMAFSAAEAQKTRDWQEVMSSTAVQRMQKDMLAAGINPMLAAGEGESTPSGATGQAAGYTAQPLPSWLNGVVSGAKDTIRLMQDLRESNSRVSKNRMDADSNWARSESAAEVNEQDKRMLMKQNEMLDNELRIYRGHPDFYGTSRLLNDRGIGVGNLRGMFR